jgi:hypothetical protein
MLEAQTAGLQLGLEALVVDPHGGQAVLVTLLEMDAAPREAPLLLYPCDRVQHRNERHRDSRGEHRVPLESPLQGSVRTRTPEARLVQTIGAAPTILTLTTRTAPTPHGSWAFALLKLAAGHIFEEGKTRKNDSSARRLHDSERSSSRKASPYVVRRLIRDAGLIGETAGAQKEDAYRYRVSTVERRE